MLAMTYTKYPQACKAFIAYMMEGGRFQQMARGSKGYLTHPLNAYDSARCDSRPKRTIYREAAKRTLTAGGLSSVGEKAAAIAGFVVLDMFANYCTGREDVKGTIAIAERQLKRIYR